MENTPPLNKRFYPFTPYQRVVLLCTPIWNQLAFNGARVINKTFHHYRMALPIDDLFPFLPWTIVIYFGCFLFWAVNYILVSMESREKSDRFFLADLLSKLVCLTVFVLFPATMERPEVTGSDIFSQIVRILYRIDPPTSLFPSMHCLVSWLCWIGVRRSRRIPPIYKWFSFLFAIAVCVSTLTVRQHVFVDTVAGVLLAEASYFAAGSPKLLGQFRRGTDKILSFFQKK